VILLSCNTQLQIKPASLGIGANTIAQRINGQAPVTGTLETNAATTQKSGSILLVSLARGAWDSAPNAPTDNHANTFTLQGSTHTYIDWTNSATGLYHTTAATGGANHVFSMLWNNSDEVSLSAVEVKGATTIEDSSWIEQPAAERCCNPGRVVVGFRWGSGCRKHAQSDTRQWIYPHSKRHRTGQPEHQRLHSGRHRLPHREYGWGLQRDMANRQRRRTALLGGASVKTMTLEGIHDHKF
jgi:hypothetical protein